MNKPLQSLQLVPRIHLKISHWSNRYIIQRISLKETTSIGRRQSQSTYREYNLSCRVTFNSVKMLKQKYHFVLRNGVCLINGHMFDQPWTITLICAVGSAKGNIISMQLRNRTYRWRHMPHVSKSSSISSACFCLMVNLSHFLSIRLSWRWNTLDILDNIL
jgi:hypothetical protein